MKKLLLSLIVMLVFLTGFLSCYALTGLSNKVYFFEKPFTFGLINEREQPGNWIDNEKISVFPDKIVIYVRNAILSSFASTGSMLPVLGENANGIEIKPESAEQIKIGDIIAFKKDNMLIVHRVIDKGEDEQGSWFITKGDNSDEIDGKVYFTDVEYVTIGIVY